MKTTREQVLQAYPEAVFMPWDKPIIGQRVRRLDTNRIGTVVGREDEKTKVGMHRIGRFFCSTCSCEYENAFYGWWIVEYDGYEENGKPVQFSEYPPALVPAEKSFSG